MMHALVADDVPAAVFFADKVPRYMQHRQYVRSPGMIRALHGVGVVFTRADMNTLMHHLNDDDHRDILATIHKFDGRVSTKSALTLIHYTVCARRTHSSFQLQFTDICVR